MTSMEEFGPVAVDYFTGRRVEEVTGGDGAEGSPVWTIHFEGGGLVHNFDPTIPIPTTILGAALTKTLLERAKTRLHFGLEVVTLNPIEYAIVDPTYTKGQVVYAQRSRANMPPPPAHPDERIAEGPSQEWLDAEKQRLASLDEDEPDEDA